SERIIKVVGDLQAPRLGISDEQVAELKGNIDHLFHLAAMYDMTAEDEQTEELNVEGTRHTVELANAIDAGIFHHTSSVAAAGLYKGLYREDMFDEGQKLPSAYHRTKFESEKIVREEVQGAWRVYRPAIVVGHSRTGEMDKIDGPYYFFKAIQRLRHFLPEWFPLLGPELGYTNIVPVDYVTAAMDHIAHEPDLFKDRSFEGAVNGKVALITGASSGIGKAAAQKIAAAGGIPLLVARSADKLEETKKEIEDAGGTAYTYSADLSDTDSIEG